MLGRQLKCTLTIWALGLDDMASIATSEDTDKAFCTMDKALKVVFGERLRLGACQNRLEHAYNATTNTAGNLTAAECRIRDVDIAKEMMNMVKAQNFIAGKSICASDTPASGAVIFNVVE